VENIIPRGISKTKREKMSKLKQDKIPVFLDEDNIIRIGVEQGVIENEFNWKLVRLNDGKTLRSKEILWLEWNEEGRFKEKHDKPEIGRSLIMSPFNEFFTWQTTDIKEILDNTEDLIKFRTSNSNYVLERIK
jgi:hypothetical protein